MSGYSSFSANTLSPGSQTPKTKRGGETATPPVFGRIKFEGKDLPPQPATYDKLAMGSGRSLLFVSIVAETNFVKAIRSILGGGAKAHIYAQDGKIKHIDNPYSQPVHPEKLVKVDEGYDCYLHKMDHGLTHAVFVARTDGFMLSVTDEAVRRQLNDIRFTTPFLPEWTPYIREQLKAKRLLSTASCFNCACGTLDATTADLDAVIVAGLKSRKLIIPGG